MLPPFEQRDARLFHTPATPVPIFQRQYEWWALLDIYTRLAPMRTLEIGTFHGGSLYHLLRLARPGATVVSIDSYTAGVDNRALYANWTPAGVELVVIEGDSRDDATISAAARAAPFDLVFIDADHMEASVQADWENYRALAAPGAIVAFHDILPAAVEWIQVNQVWDRLRRLGYTTRELIADPQAEWGGWGLILT